VLIIANGWTNSRGGSKRIQHIQINDCGTHSMAGSGYHCLSVVLGFSPIRATTDFESCIGGLRSNHCLSVGFPVFAFCRNAWI
jgi:hypothetical protein